MYTMESVVRVVPQLPALTTPSKEVETMVADTVTIMVAEAAMAAVSALERADKTVMSVATGATGEQFVHNVQRHLMKMCPSRQKMAPCGQRIT
jgi:predicted CDP-diglyceride synthetase/phosphatidate cytidylyltransferase